jgi:DNA polymerase I-like protein with 3'-5' exonuclease and polymerase domains
VLECPKPKAAHNGKFDAPFIERLQGIKINNIVWDTLCGQHWLSEDQKGVYGLKALTPTYAPEYEGYEDRLHDALRHGEEVAPTEEDILKEAQELMAASGCVSDSTWLEGGDIPDEAEIEEEQANNDKWLVDPVWPEGAIEADVQAYKELRDLWFTLDAAGSGKERGVAWRRWKKLAKKMGLPEPTPTPAKEMSKDAGGFEGVAVNTLLPYAAADADVTRIILKKQYRKLRVTGVWDEAHSVMRNLYIPASRALGDLEYRGVKVDLNKALDYDSQLTVVLDTTQQRIYNLALRHFKINASHQLAEVLNNMGFRTDQRTKNDQVKTSKDVIVGYQKEMVAALQTASETDKPHLLRRLEFLESLMLYKAAQKMKTSFIRRLREYASLDGHIHTTFHLTGTSSGRLSSSKLNLQNLPAYMCRISRPNPADPENPVVVHSGFNVKALLIPENDKEVFWNLDIKAAEIRVAAYYSGDAGLIQALNDGLDVHTFFLTKIKHPTFDDAALRQQYGIYKQAIDQGDEELSNLRSAVKRVVFGTLYGAGPRKIASQIGENFPVEEAKKIIDALFTAFPGIKKYVQETKSEVKLKGQVSTIFGRYRRFMLAAVSSELRSKSEREAVNFKIQSTSSDLVVSQLCEINDHLHEIEAVMRLTVHDSMAGTIKKSRVKDMKAFFDYWLVDRVKERFPWMPVPFLYDLEVGPSYGEKMKYKDWVKEHAAA